MSDLLLPASVRDERFARLEQVLVDRLASIDLSALIVNAVNFAAPAAIPYLGEQWRALDSVWNEASLSERRMVLQRVLARRRKRGTPWAVRDGLASIGHVDLDIRRRPALVADGSLYADGTFKAAGPNRFVCWLVFQAASLLSTPEKSKIAATVVSWKQKSVHLDDPFLFYVEDSADFGVLPEYEAETTIPIVLSCVSDAAASTITIEVSRTLVSGTIEDWPALWADDWSLTGTIATVVSMVITGRVVTLELSEPALEPGTVSLTYSGDLIHSRLTGTEVPIVGTRVDRSAVWPIAAEPAVWFRGDDPDANINGTPEYVSIPNRGLAAGNIGGTPGNLPGVTVFGTKPAPYFGPGYAGLNSTAGGRFTNSVDDATLVARVHVTAAGTEQNMCGVYELGDDSTSLNILSGKFALRAVEDGFGTISAVSSPNGVVPGWNTVIAVKSGDQIDLYVNGALQASGTLDLPASNDTSYIVFGARDDGSYPMLGTIAELLLLPRAIDASEVAAAETYLSRWS